MTGRHGLGLGAVTERATRMLADLLAGSEHAESDAKTLRFSDGSLEKIMFELAQRAWKPGAHSDGLNAERSQMLGTTVAEDETDLVGQLTALQGLGQLADGAHLATPKTQPGRNPIQGQLCGVEHQDEHEGTTCPAPNCGEPITRVGEYVGRRVVGPGQPAQPCRDSTTRTAH